ncbi:MAG: hypothetical protein KAW87_05725 [Candidatus Cloacimonetes bacterium]|jgi:hypothetical protein|nr:hypothetical protein [Candidatus Cloacimonadota bacterium]
MQKIGGGLRGPEWTQFKGKVDELIKALDYEPLELAKIKEMACEIKERLDRLDRLI